MQRWYWFDPERQVWYGCDAEIAARACVMGYPVRLGLVTVPDCEQWEL